MTGIEINQEKWRRDFSEQIVKQFYEEHKFVEISDLIDFGTSFMVYGDSETVEKIVEEGKNLCGIYENDLISLQPGKEIVTPAGVMLIPQDRPLWVLNEAAALLEDMDATNLDAEIETVGKEFDFSVGFSNIILGLAIEGKIMTSMTMFRFSDMMMRTMKYKKELLSALTEVGTSATKTRVCVH